ncbi:MAG: PIN domain-containing protein [Candidatus Limnocylindria bacterium]
MRRVVVDSAIVLEWFTDAAGPAHSIRREYEAGELTAVVPRSLTLDILEAVARSSGWPADRLGRLAAELERLRFEVRDPTSTELTAWLARGLSGRDAGYAALASGLGIPLVTTDAELLRNAASVAQRP